MPSTAIEEHSKVGIEFRAQPGQCAALNRRAAQQFRLGPKKIDQLFRIEPALVDIESAGQPHPGLRLIGGQRIEAQDTDRPQHQNQDQNNHPPVPAQQKPPPMQPSIQP